MTTLESRYRRLLRVYPAGHRAAYQEEMIGVLMFGAEPGRRFPAPADAIDLVRAGLTARIRDAFTAQRGTGWRDAAAVVALIAAVVMTGTAVERLADGLVMWTRTPMRAYGFDGLLVAEPAIRVVTWAVVVLVAVLGRRRSAVVAATAGVLVQAATVMWWAGLEPWQSLRLVWMLASALLILVLFAVAASGRPARAVLGYRGSGLVAGAVALAALFHGMLWTGPLAVPVDVGLLLLSLLPAAVVAAAVTGTRPRVRARIAVLGSVVVAVPVVFNVLEVVARWSALIGLTTGIVAGAVVVLASTPVVVFLVGLVSLRLGERFTDGRAGHVRMHE